MSIMLHKPAQIDNMSRMNCDTLYITTYNSPDLFKNFNITFNCDHKFHEIISENVPIIIVQMEWLMNFVMI